MRFNEFGPSTDQSSNTEGTFVTLIQFLLNKASMSGNTDRKDVKVPTSTVLALMNNTGIGLGYPDLDALVKNSDTLGKLVKSMNKDEVVFSNASSETDDDTSGEDDKVVDQMASRASSKRED